MSSPYGIASVATVFGPIYLSSLFASVPAKIAQPLYFGDITTGAKSGIANCATIGKIYEKERTEQRNYKAPKGHVIYADPTY